MSPMLFIFGLFLIGMILIACEAFVIPGFGLPGIGGAGLVIYAAMEAWSEPSLGPMVAMLIGMLTLFLTLAMVIYVPRTRLGKALSLRTTISARSGYDTEAKRAGVAVGQSAITVTDLKPSGFARFGDHRVEVRSAGEWIGRDVTVEVIQLKGGQVLVEESLAEPDVGVEQTPSGSDDARESADDSVSEQG